MATLEMRQLLSDRCLVGFSQLMHGKETSRGESANQALDAYWGVDYRSSGQLASLSLPTDFGHFLHATSPDRPRGPFQEGRAAFSCLFEKGP